MSSISAQQLERDCSKTFLEVIRTIRLKAGEREYESLREREFESLNTNFNALNRYLNGDEFQLYARQDAKLLFGLYVYVNPYQMRTHSPGNEMPYTLWNSESFRTEPIKPSFELPVFISETAEKETVLSPVDSDFKAFIQSINTYFRQNQEFQRQDFIKLFTSNEHNKEKRNRRDRDLGILYIPSGEIDHCIFQLLAFDLARTGGFELDSRVQIDLTHLANSDMLISYWESTKSKPSLHEKLSQVLRFKSRSKGNAPSIFLLSSKKQTKQPIFKWLTEWGYLVPTEEIIPTEKMIACLEYAYFMLFPDNEDEVLHRAERYLSLINDNDKILKKYFDGFDKTPTAKKFAEKFETYLNRVQYLLELTPETFNGNRNDLLSGIEWPSILNLYFQLLKDWTGKEEGRLEDQRSNFVARGRIRPFIHFLNRSLHGYFSPGRIEQACRGVIFHPILHMPSAFEAKMPGTTNNRLQYAGFFLCNIKDSDGRGFNYFNWRTTYSKRGEQNKSETKYESTTHFFDTTLPQLLIVANELGDIETEAVFFDGIISKGIDEQTKQATRAAISQVMARNSSHNIGSHVLTKFKAKKDILSNQSKLRYASDEEIASPTNLGSSKQHHQYDGAKHGLQAHEDLENESQIAYFNEYLKNRMDLLADIATADPVMESPMRLISEIFKGFDRNRILLNRISGVTDQDLKFRFELTDSRKKDRSNFDSKADLLVSMTNDVLGAQAFYIILENIIRNICKHGKMGPADKGNLNITIDVGENENHPSFYEISVFDNLKRRSYPSGKKGNESLPVENSIEEIVIRRNHAFNAELIDKTDNRVRPTGLGTIEMDVCASYLRCLPIDASQNNAQYDLQFCGDNQTHKNQGHHHVLGEVTNNHTSDQPMLMFAYKEPVLDEAGDHSTDKKGFRLYSLGYKFYIPKPKQVLVLTDDPAGFIIAGLDQNSLGCHGIKAIKVETLTSELDRGQVFNHQFLYNHDNNGAVDSLLKSHFAALPKRRIGRLESEALASQETFVSRLWEEYAALQCIGDSNRAKFTNEVPANTAEFVSSNGRLEAAPDHTSIDGTLTRIFVDNHDSNWCGNSTVICDEMDCGECHVCLGDKCSCKEEDYYPAHCDYYDMKCGHTRLDDDKADALTDQFCDSGLTLIRAQYIEVVFTDAVVIDERIQANVCGTSPKDRRKYNENFEFYQYFKRQGVHIPTVDDANLNITDFGRIDIVNSEADKLREYLRAHLRLQRRGFYILHLGIIEKLVDETNQNGAKDGDDVHKVIKSLFDGFENRLKDVVITSGRGTPDNLPIDCMTKKKIFPFVPIASIQNAIETQFDKYLLTKLLYNSRRTN